uniref:NADH dehydrogenase subunit 1 n=1 Tax=Cocculina enigmadonta TaxID=2729702 RepID=UPI002209C2A8|nr:NADH dehydrogenase subunit 1 [Cocculina enigmadonta]UXN84356.1 NADH dehydrogenase subunit 1 [Cocculina enigmadonta]
MIVSSLSIIITYVCVLLGLAFFTLLERKGLSYSQTRKGPNKVGIMGLPQPLADALKLLSKEMAKPLMVNQVPYFIAPVLSLVLALLLWQVLPSCSVSFIFKLGVMFFLCVSSMNVYGTLIAGWGSNSKYALLGAVRAVAQTISYEVSLALVLMFCLFLSFSLDFGEISVDQSLVWFFFLMVPMGVVWFLTCVAETNRAPFDFAEGESELVSGFNIEYGGGGFALIFMAEYGNILLMSMLTSCIFFGGSSILFFNDFFMCLKILFFCFVFVWLRASFPRFRYDLLMNLTWKGILPFSLGALGMVVGLSFLV